MRLLTPRTRDVACILEGSSDACVSVMVTNEINAVKLKQIILTQ